MCTSSCLAFTVACVPPRVYHLFARPLQFVGITYSDYLIIQNFYCYNRGRRYSCPCYIKRTECPASFEKVMELKNAGLVVYCHLLHEKVSYQFPYFKSYS